MSFGAAVFAKAKELGVGDGEPVAPQTEQTEQVEGQDQSAEGQQEQPAQAAPSTEQPPQMVPVQRLSAATRKGRMLQEQLAQQQQAFTQQQQAFESKIKGLEDRLEALSKAQGPKPGGEDAWLEEYLETGDTGGVRVSPEMKALKERLDELHAWKEAQVRQEAERQSDAMLDSELEKLAKDCPNFDEETLLTMLAQQWSPERIVAKHATMKWALAIPPQPARKPAPPPPPQIAQPGSAPAPTRQKMSWDEWLKSGLKNDLGAV